MPSDHTRELEKLYVLSMFSAEKIDFDARVRLDEIFSPDLRAILDCLYVSDEAHGLHDIATVLAQMIAEKNPYAKACERLSEEFQFVTGHVHRSTQVRRAALNRRYHELSVAATKAFDSADPDTGLATIQQIVELSAERDNRFRTLDLGEAIGAARREMKALMDGRSKRVKFGESLFDGEIGGLLPGSMMTIGGRTSAGKSGLALRLALNMADRGTRVGIISLEDPEELVGSRSLAAIGDMPLSWLFTGAGYGEEAKEKFRRDADKVQTIAESYQIRLVVAIGARSDAVVTESDKLIRSYRPDILIVDHLQAARFPLNVARHDKAVADFAAQVKGLCHRAEIPMILTSQLRRADGSAFQEPHLRDLKESGDIENASEVVVLLWKDNDKRDARTLGKIAKIKWGIAGARFVLDRSATHGMVTGMTEVRR